MVRVVVAEDSLTLRELLVELLRSDPEIEVVGEAKTGAEAVELAARLRPDLIAMDIHMPVMDGLEATKEVMVRAQTPIVLITSSTSREDARLSLDALRAGALMVIPKPDNPASPAFDGRREHLLSMVKAMAQVKVVRQWQRHLARRPPVPRPPRRRPATQLIAMAASTGGPVSLQHILTSLPADCEIPIVIVQHIAEGFVAPLASWLNESCNLRVKVAEDGEPLAPRTVYLAPDRFHLGATSGGQAELSAAPPIGGHRPSATHLFSSAARSYGPRLTAVILTGMGRDGVDGLRQVKTAGGWVVAQDEASSVVYGMPGEAVREALVDVVLPLDEIGPYLATLIESRTRADPNPRS
jgi:two-component system chemotaxis response regulator CheB